MRLKSLIFTGIVLLIAGILLRKLTELNTIGLSLIIIGIACKTLYIILKGKNGEYKPGKELIILIVGLFLFLTGLYFKNNELTLINSTYLIVTGIILKIIFIIKFIQIIRSSKTQT